MKREYYQVVIKTPKSCIIWLIVWPKELSFLQTTSVHQSGRDLLSVNMPPIGWKTVFRVACAVGFQSIAELLTQSYACLIAVDWICMLTQDILMFVSIYLLSDNYIADQLSC